MKNERDQERAAVLAKIYAVWLISGNSPIATAHEVADWALLYGLINHDGWQLILGGPNVPLAPE